LAAYVASRCGLLHRFECVAAVNANDAMARLLAGMPLMKGETQPTLSPAMDIQLPSNFERLLFEASGRDGAAVAAAYAQLAAKGEAPLPRSAAARLGAMGLSAERVSDQETREEMKRTYAETGWIVCPHTAVGLAAARRNRIADGPVVTLATAHAAKFPETVQDVLGLTIGLPDRAAGFAARREQFETGPMSADFVRKRIEAIVART
jgi:threonine synthase